MPDRKEDRKGKGKKDEESQAARGPFAPGARIFEGSRPMPCSVCSPPGLIMPRDQYYPNFQSRGPTHEWCASYLQKYADDPQTATVLATRSAPPPEPAPREDEPPASAYDDDPLFPGEENDP